MANSLHLFIGKEGFTKLNLTKLTIMLKNSHVLLTDIISNNQIKDL